MEYKFTATVDVLTTLLQDFINESVYKLKVSQTKVQQLLDSPNILKIVVYDADKPVALFMGYTYQHPIFDGKASDDLLIYVDKEHRGGSIAYRLIKHYEQWSKSMGVDYIQISQSTGNGDVDRIRCFYEKLGYTTTGYNAMKGI